MIENEEITNMGDMGEGGGVESKKKKRRPSEDGLLSTLEGQNSPLAHSPFCFKHIINSFSLRCSRILEKSI